MPPTVGATGLAGFTAERPAMTVIHDDDRPGAESFAHATAVIDPGADIGRGTRVWHHAHIRAGSVVGDGCNIGKNVYVDHGAIIGNRVKIQNNVSIYRGVEIEDEVFVGPSAVFTNDRFPRASNTSWEVARTVVRRGASIGANATIVCGVEIGSWSAVGAGAVVTRSVADHELVVGNPARRAGWMCRCGRVASREPARPEDCRCPWCIAAAA